MANIMQFTKENLKLLRPEIESALAEVGKKYGFSMTLGNMSFDASTFTSSIRGGMITEGGDVVTPEKVALDQLGKMYLGENFNPSLIYTRLGKKIKFVGISPKRSRYPIIYQDIATGKKYKIDEEGARFVVNTGGKEVA